ncbi:MAG: hypothetical protein RBU37_02625 [Myxococcota bacterium]|nr:hypothetical protein [Myxococcota bacterium]
MRMPKLEGRPWGNRPSAQSTRTWGTGQVPNRQELGEQAKCPIDKKVENLPRRFLRRRTVLSQRVRLWRQEFASVALSRYHLHCTLRRRRRRR